MPPPTPREPQSGESVPDGSTRLGGWLFRYRSAIPLPIVVLLLIPSSGPSAPACLSCPFCPSCPSRLTGVLLVLAGELVRLWAVRHIGVISRTRSDRVGPLVDSGPFAWVRNPLYLGNILLWVGFTLSAGLLWLAPLVAALLAFEYHAIVRWEERLVESRIGALYLTYKARVPRWVPRLIPPMPRSSPPTLFSWRETFFSERGTLIAIAAGYAVLAVKDRLWALGSGTRGFEPYVISTLRLCQRYQHATER